MKIKPALTSAVSVLLVALLGASRAGAQTRQFVAKILEQRVDDFGVQGQEARTVLEGLGAAYRFPVVVEPDVQGQVTFEVHNASVGTVIDAICQPKGWSYEVSGRGYLLIRRFVTRIYPVDYLQMTQAGSSSASINLSESAGGFAGSTAGVLGGIGGTAATGLATGQAATTNSGSVSEGAPRSACRSRMTRIFGAGSNRTSREWWARAKA